MLLYEEKITQLREEMGERVAIIEKSLVEMKENHVKLLKRSSEITKTITESIEATHKHHNYQ